MPIQGIYIFKSESGVSLYSEKMLDVHEDIFSAFLSAIKAYFKSLSVGGLLSFSTEYYIFYLSNFNNISTTLIVDLQEKERSDNKYFSLSYDICEQFYKDYKKYVNSEITPVIPNVNDLNSKITNLISKNEQIIEKQQELIRLYKLSKSGELEQFEYQNERQLQNENIFVAVNNVTKKIYVVENSEYDIPGRLLYLANRGVTNLNNSYYKSQCSINNVSDHFDFERIVGVIDYLLSGLAIII